MTRLGIGRALPGHRRRPISGVSFEDILGRFEATTPQRSSCSSARSAARPRREAAAFIARTQQAVVSIILGPRHRAGKQMGMLGAIVSAGRGGPMPPKWRRWGRRVSGGAKTASETARLVADLLRRS